MPIVTDRMTRALGYQQVNAAGTAATFNLTVPTNRENIKPRFAVIQAEAQALRYRDDGVDPTATVGMLIPSGTSIDYTGDFNKIRLINATAGAIANISYYQ